MTRPAPLLFASLALGLALSWTARAADEPARTANAQEAEFFEAKVRPVLAEHCLACHGPDKQRSGLRLDSAAAVRKGGDGGPVVVAGDPENSPLIEAIRYDGATLMPPKGKLPEAAIADLTRWVQMGAPWPGGDARPAEAEAWRTHWAFQPVSNPPVPPVRDGAWPRTTVDRFILAKLEASGLAPSPPASRRDLIRRATFDLIGLPPTPEEVAAFEADTTPDAYETLIERLLASPHYGERWGRHWLDVARYADTKGYVFLQEPNYPFAYTYRDYVVRALNEDLPYDRFLVEQLAADRLPLGEDKRALAALGFLTVGGRFMNNRQDILDDRIDVTTRGLMGLTVACARCHDHKFDPIPAEDYYSLYGVFASSNEPAVPPLFEPPPSTEQYAKFAAELAAREARLAEFIRAKHDELVASARHRAAEYMLAAHASRQQPGTDEFMLLADGGDLNPRMLQRWQRFLRRSRGSHHPVMAAWNALASLKPENFAGESAAYCRRLVEAPDPAKPINPIVAQALANEPPKALADAARAYAHLLNNNEAICQDYARRAALEGRPASPHPDPAREELSQVFHGPDAPPDIPMNPEGDLALLPDRPSQAKLQELRKAVEDWRTSGPGAPPRAMTLEDMDKPVEPRVFLRGNPGNPGKAVPRRFLRVVAGEDRPPFRDGSGRLDLARAIVDKSNPLTARVMVNRIWMHHFGAPIVGTPGDFGLRSEPPTHPELLDHLASAFMAGGWSVKQMHRLIMLSATYRQSSGLRGEEAQATADPNAKEPQVVDPENRLLWRMNRRRLDFESTRDALLAASGQLDRTLGGRPFPDLASPKVGRRTLYGLVDRLNLPGLFRTFDFPDPNATSPRRDQTTVPPQALFLMNNPFVLESARALLRRPELAGEPDAGRRVDRLYRLLYGRAPSADEAALAAEFLADGRPATWERYVQALLIANEFVFVD